MRQEILALAMCLDKLSATNPQMKCTQASQLLTMALNEGSTLSEIAAKCDASLPGVSRNIKVFGGKKRADDKGGAFKKAWISIEPNPVDDREKLISLTPDGKEGIDELVEIMSSVSTQDPVRGLLKDLCRELGDQR